MDVALACSGTVTTELAAQGAPMVVGYRLGWVTWVSLGSSCGSRLIMSLNVAAKRKIAPEFLQTRFRRESCAQRSNAFLTAPDALAQQRQDQDAAIKKMAGPGKGPQR